MTEFQKACREATEAGVEDAAKMTDEEVRGQEQRNKRLGDDGSAEISLPLGPLPLDGPKLIREAVRLSNEERAAYEKKHGKPMPLPKVS